MAAPETLPEGTDTIVNGASDSDANPRKLESASGATSETADVAAAKDDGFDQATISDRIQGFKGQAGDKARDFATQGRDKAADAINNLVKMIEDAAGQIDDKLGGNYGDYARQGAQTLAGFSSQIQEKNVDELFDDARSLIAKSPAIAVAAAATAGFVLARLGRAAADAATEAASAATNGSNKSGGGAA